MSRAARLGAALLAASAAAWGALPAAGAIPLPAVTGAYEAPGAAAAEPVDASALLDDALEHPPGPYEGRLMITRWYGKRTRAEEVRVYWGSDGRYRWEFLAPDGKPDRLVVCDGQREELRFPRRKKAIRGEAVNGAWKLMSREKERDLLLRNYKAELAGTEQVLGRPARIIALVPKEDGKPRQRLWVDVDTRAILENKRYLPGGALATVSRFSRYRPKESLQDSLFELETDTNVAVEEHGLDPDFMTIADLDKALGRPSSLPQTLPGGFEFESADFFNVGSKVVRHMRYTDGLVVLSLFETDQPVRLGSQAASELAPSKDVPGSLWVSSSGKLLQWKTGRRHYTLIGEVSGQLLARVSAAVRQGLEPPKKGHG